MEIFNALTIRPNERTVRAERRTQNEMLNDATTARMVAEICPRKKDTS